MSTAVVPVSALPDAAAAEPQAGGSTMGTIRAAAWAKKVKKKTEVVSHNLRNMFISMVPLFALIGLAAFILQLIEYDNELLNAQAFVEQTTALTDKIASLQLRTTATLDLGNLDRLHAPVEEAAEESATAAGDEDSTKPKNVTFHWTTTMTTLHCYKNGTKEDLSHQQKVVRFFFFFLPVLFFCFFFFPTRLFTQLTFKCPRSMFP